MDKILDKLRNNHDLSFEESKHAFQVLMEGKASDDQIYYFLTLLSKKGEVADEIAGGVYILREKSKRVNVVGAIDTC
jgi:anthranilate phosphoribosyltransferase